MSDQFRTYTCSELNRLIKAGQRVVASVIHYEGEHRVLGVRVAAHERLQAQVCVGGQTFWRNIVTLRIAEKEVHCA